jgi:hypothetical protein
MFGGGGANNNNSNANNNAPEGQEPAAADEESGDDDEDDTDGEEMDVMGAAGKIVVFEDDLAASEQMRLFDLAVLMSGEIDIIDHKRHLKRHKAGACTS